MKLLLMTLVWRLTDLLPLFPFPLTLLRLRWLMLAQSARVGFLILIIPVVFAQEVLRPGIAMAPLKPRLHVPHVNLLPTRVRVTITVFPPRLRRSCSALFAKSMATILFAAAAMARDMIRVSSAVASYFD